MKTNAYDNQRRCESCGEEWNFQFVALNPALFKTRERTVLSCPYCPARRVAAFETGRQLVENFEIHSEGESKTEVEKKARQKRLALLREQYGIKERRTA